MAQAITVEDIEKIMAATHDSIREFAVRLEVSEQAVRYWLKDNTGNIHPRNLKELNKLKRKHLS